MCGARLGAAYCELWPTKVFKLQLRVLAAVADLIGSLPGLAPELVRGGVLRQLLRLVRHPNFEYRDDACDDNVAKESCDAIMAKVHTTYMMQMVMQMVDVLRACAKRLPQVRPRLALAAVQLCMRWPLPC